MAKQLELNFDENVPTFIEWFTAVNVEHHKYGEKPYTISEGVKVYKKLVKSDFFKMQSNIWNSKNENRR